MSDKTCARIGLYIYEAILILSVIIFFGSTALISAVPSAISTVIFYRLSVKRQAYLERRGWD